MDKYGALPTRLHSDQVSANTAAWKVSPLFELPHNFLRDLIFINANPVGMNAAPQLDADAGYA